MKNKAIATVFSSLVAGSLLWGCGGSSSSSSNKPSPPSPAQNKAPVISPLSAPSVHERRTFTLTAKATDSDGSIAQYTWKQIKGSAVTRLVANKATLSFVAPEVSNDETLTFSLTVKDNKGASSSAELSVPVTAFSPIDLSLFSDSELRACIEKQSIKDIGIESLTCLGHYNRHTKDLAGLEQLVNLRTLNLRRNPLTNTSPLSSLINLEDLNLTDTRLADLSFVPKLKKLVSLNVSTNYNLLSIDELQNANALRILNLTGTRVVSLAPLLSTPNIEDLNLTSLDSSNNRQIDTTSLKKLTGLKVFTIANVPSDNFSSALPFLKNLTKLNLSNTNTTTLDDLVGMTSLRELNLNKNRQISDLTPLSQIPTLEKLQLIKTSIPNFSFLKGLKNLKDLAVVSPSVGQSFSASDFAALIKLERLVFKYFAITDSLSLSKLDKLTHLELDGMEINTGSTPLLTPKNLEQLHVFNVQFTTMPDFSNSKKLKHVGLFASEIKHLRGERIPTSLISLSINGVSTISGLTADHKLTGLSIHFGRDPKHISHLTVLQGLTSLTVGSLPNQESLSFVTSLSSLEIIGISNSPVLRSLAPLEGLSKLKKLSLSNTDYISCSELDAIKKRGISIESNHSVPQCVKKRLDLSLIESETLKTCVKDSTSHPAYGIDVTKMKHILCKKSALTNLTGIENLIALEKFEFIGSTQLNLSPLSQMTTITEMIIKQVAPQNLSPLLGLKKMTKLTINDTQQFNVSTLPKLDNLNLLDLTSNQISNLTDFPTIEKLETLHLSNNNIVDVSPIKGFSSLKTLSLYRNKNLSCDAIKKLKAQNNPTLSVGYDTCQ